MVITDRIAKYFVKYVVIPKVTQFDIPGFIIENQKGIWLRNVLLPEDFFVNLERGLKEREKEKLYSVGKNFLWNYLRWIGAPKKGKRGVRVFLEFIVKYFETMFAKELTYKADFSQDIYRFEAKDFMVCRKSGVGTLFSEGCMAGFWAWISGRKDLEAVHIGCEGRKDPKCVTMVAAREVLEGMGHKVKGCRIAEISIPKEYFKLNSPTSPQSFEIASSVKALLDSRILKYVGGRLDYKDFRLIPSEIFLLSLIERNLEKKRVFRASLDAFEDMFGDMDLKSSLELLSAMGFGFFAVSKNRVIARKLPWYPRNKGVPFLEGFFASKGFKLKSLYIDGWGLNGVFERD